MRLQSDRVKALVVDIGVYEGGNLVPGSLGFLLLELLVDRNSRVSFDRDVLAIPLLAFCAPRRDSPASVLGAFRADPGDASRALVSTRSPRADRLMLSLAASQLTASLHTAPLASCSVSHSAR